MKGDSDQTSATAMVDKQSCPGVNCRCTYDQTSMLTPFQLAALKDICPRDLWERNVQGSVVRWWFQMGLGIIMIGLISVDNFCQEKKREKFVREKLDTKKCYVGKSACSNLKRNLMFYSISFFGNMEVLPVNIGNRLLIIVWTKAFFFSALLLVGNCQCVVIRFLKMAIKERIHLLYQNKFSASFIQPIRNKSYSIWCLYLDIKVVFKVKCRMKKYRNGF